MVMLCHSYKISNNVLTPALLNFELHVNFNLVSSGVSEAAFGFNAAHCKDALFI